MSSPRSPQRTATSPISVVPLVGALFFTPLAFGGTTDWSVFVQDCLLALAFLLWLPGLLLKRRIPRIPKLCLGAILGLAVIGVISWMNPAARHVPITWQFVEVADSIKWLPGTMDQSTSTAVLRHLLALLLAFVVLLDQVSHSKQRWLLLRTIALSGFVIAIIGIAQKAEGADSMLWTNAAASGERFFGAFRYHANAASFLLLSWPAALAVWLRSHSRKPHPIVKSLDAIVLVVLLAALFVNTSKAGHLLGLLGITGAIFRFRKQIFAFRSSRATLIISLLLLGLFLTLAVVPAILVSIEGWAREASEGASFEGRILAYQACIRALGETGLFGTGPGTFHLVFPYFTANLGDKIFGLWFHAHQDYLQAMIEWGYLGFLCWAILVGGGFFFCLRSRILYREDFRFETSISCTLIALSLVLLHSMIDFPLQIPAIQLPFTVFLAIAWTTRFSLARSSAPATSH